MTTSSGRARPMSRDDRRAAIATATVPLLARYGAAVTTRQIAQAANVAEGTLFRAFEDKDELIHAALVAALDPAPLVRAIQGLPEHGALETTLVALADLIQESQRATARIVQVAHQVMGDRPGSGALHGRPGGPGSGADQRHGDHGPDTHRDARMSAVQDIVGAIEARIAPFATELRTEPRVAASVFFFLVHGHASPMMSQGGPLDPTQIVDVFLHGVLDDPCRANGPPAVPVPTASLA
ncbi:TetR/AcrR family transcriptional regulator [Oerskovia jenensis]|uniref:AcrR family transcriptional regulator n=1 Tax=Oerskovia jenensis TaxID=162169 RepID=A0ABS2LBP9_9CELL|nr:TetR/AcrR family transcriptional regulator [Oerskovia jenensis]MBM7477604.1 AcrR family transcriptional regulator [Oerskovia jenensis]